MRDKTLFGVPTPSQTFHTWNSNTNASCDLFIESILRTVLPNDPNIANKRQYISHLFGSQYQILIKNLDGATDYRQVKVSPSRSAVVFEAISRAQHLYSLPQRSLESALAIESFIAWLMQVLSKYQIESHSETDDWVQFLLRIVRTRKQGGTLSGNGKGNEEVQGTIYSTSDPKEIGIILIAVGIASLLAGGPWFVGVGLIIGGAIK